MNPARTLGNILSQKWNFLVVFLLILGATVFICAHTGFIPDSDEASTTPSLSASAFSGYSPLMTGPAAALAPSASASAPVSAAQAPTSGNLNMDGDLPVRVIIPTLGTNVTVANPATFDVDALDQYLLKGAARYPSSATLGEQGNVILFGHSSYLPVVNNKAFKTFDGIQNLKAGDRIEVDSATTKYVYSVQTVQKESATTDGIELTNTGYTLTLATCNSFATKSDRFVVTATLLGTSVLSQ